MTTKG